MDKLNPDLTEDVLKFINEWNSSSEFIDAFTSGSTGKPKKIRLSKEMMRRSAKRSIDFFGIDSDSTLYLPLSADYIAGKMQIVRALISGCKLISEAPSQSPLSNLQTQNTIKLLPIVGAQLPGLCKNLALNPDIVIENLLIGGAPVTPFQRELACAGNWKVWESYGMTETASHIALRDVRKGSQEPFKVLPGIRITQDEDSCLVIDMGADGILKTNDIAELTGPESFRIIGRKDNVIITGGKKVYPEEIERIISHLIPNNFPFMVTSRPSEIWGDEIILIVESKEKLVIDFKSLPLQSHQRPRDIICVDKIPVSETGKILRHKRNFI